MTAPFMLRYEYRKSSPAKALWLQSHDHFEIFYFHEGQGDYLIGDQIHALQPGTLIIMHGLTPHSPSSLGEHPYVRSLINFDPAYVRTASRQLFEVHVLEPFEKLCNHAVRLQSGQQKEMEELLAKMNGLYGREGAAAYDRFRLAFLDVLLFICDVLREPVRQNREERQQPHVRDVLSYLEEHFREDVTLERLENSLHLNRHYLARTFKKWTGTTIFHYLYRRRVNQAKIDFLLQPDKTVTDVCFQTGFKNVSHFSRVFKEHEGVGPEQFRRSMMRMSAGGADKVNLSKTAGPFSSTRQ
ncbi:helix-turn-helix domain-containing protein [Paenibacillus humicola]|uniref:helix-turn-helix domain-containing protein n=1 Tax=Paenibacillus humicola TaxID=3110540 RepID=UPI00237B35CF|nr:AraC family transcriptional regulator [Paenibacillus humicola]